MQILASSLDLAQETPALNLGFRGPHSVSLSGIILPMG